MSRRTIRFSLAGVGIELLGAFEEMQSSDDKGQIEAQNMNFFYK